MNTSAELLNQHGDLSPNVSRNLACHLCFTGALQLYLTEFRYSFLLLPEGAVINYNLGP